MPTQSSMQVINSFLQPLSPQSIDVPIGSTRRLGQDQSGTEPPFKKAKTSHQSTLPFGRPTLPATEPQTEAANQDPSVRVDRATVLGDPAVVQVS